MKPKQNKRETITTAIFGVIFLVSLSVMLYPTFSNWWNRNVVSHSISSYKEEVAQIDNSESEKMLAEACAYNAQLACLSNPFADFDKVPGYDRILNISGTGIMGYVSIPNINVELPIYHGTDDGVLQIAAGHIQGSSLPVGGASTHAVISGHRGLPSARLFTDLDKIVEGDIFTINVLNEVLTYEVEKIMIILPSDTEALSVIPDSDMVTLMTCTPYGVNTHRLLIRGHRIASMNQKKIKIGADALQLDAMTVIPAVFFPLLILLLLYWRITGKRRRHIRIDKYTIRNLPKR